MTKLKAYLILGFLALIWGSSFKLMKEGLYSFDAYQVAALRMVLSGITFLPFVPYRKIFKLGKDFKYFLLAGFAGNAIPAVLFTTAQTQISSSLSGALNSLTPFFTLLVGVLFLGVPLYRNRVFGVFLGLVGALMLLITDDLNIDLATLPYASLAIIATVLYGINVNIIKHKLHAYNSLMVASVPIFFVAIPNFIFLMIYGLPEFQWEQVQFLKSAGAISILSLIGTTITLIIFNVLIKHTTAVFASSVTYLIPVVALAWGYADNESIGYLQLGGLSLVLIAIWLVRQK